MPPPPPPLVVGFDTSLAHCGAAVLQGDDCLAAAYEDMARGQAERLMPMLEATLQDAGVTWQDLDGIGVGIGPGNFTGIRISVAAARGLALGLGVPAIGISVLEALAYGTDGPVLACLDARAGRGYFQRFGHGDGAPFLDTVDSVADPRPGLRCIGTLGAEMAERLAAEHAPAAFAPASAIARLATRRLPQARPEDRPTPFYLRAPDAAPPRTPPPPIL